MTRRTLPILLVLGLLAGSTAPVAGAQQKLNVYQKMVVDLIQDQRLDACKYTTAELKKAKAYVPVDAQQYNAALIAAFDDALAARAQGACNKKNKSAVATVPGVAPPPAAPGVQPPPAPAQSGSTGSQGTSTPTPGVTAAPQQAQPPPTPQSGPKPAPAILASDEITLASQTTDVVPEAPFPMLALALLLAFMALCALTFGAVRWFAWEPRWAVRFRHAAGEAGWRASSTWADFADYVRLGR